MKCLKWKLYPTPCHCVLRHPKAADFQRRHLRAGFFLWRLSTTGLNSPYCFCHSPRSPKCDREFQDVLQFHLEEAVSRVKGERFFIAHCHEVQREADTSKFVTNFDAQILRLRLNIFTTCAPTNSRVKPDRHQASVKDAEEAAKRGGSARIL